MKDMSLDEEQLAVAVRLYIKATHTNHPVADVTIIGDGNERNYEAIVEFKKETPCTRS